jgi:pimeloyl-ACP methyl ester carboxylesterase
MLATLKRLSRALLLIFVLALAACVGNSPRPNSPTPAPANGPQFIDDTAHCPWSLSGVRARLAAMTIRCGTVNVPEFHSQRNGPQLHLAVLVAQHDPDQPSGDAVIYLAGGPGNRSDPDDLISLAHAGRDVIAFDQRGVGNSNPALDCPAAGQRDPMTAAAEAQAALAACRQALISQGAHLEAYAISEDAADVNDIRQSLGYAQLDLYGLSYGTRLALAVLRDFPQNVRSTVLDSVLPMQANVVADLPAHIERALDLAFSACAADAACQQANPNLKAGYFQLVKQLNAQPATLTIGGSSVLFTGDDLTRLLLALLIGGPQRFPDFVSRIQNGELGMLSQFIADMRQDSTNTAWVMSFSVACSDDNYGTPSGLDAAATQVAAELRAPLVAGARAIMDLCDHWPVPRQPSVAAQPVRSDAPALVLEGSFDPITPPAYGQMAAQTLSRSTYVEFPDRGHSAGRRDTCGLAIVNQFIQHPDVAPDSGCVARLAPAFETAQSGQPDKIGFAITRDAMLAAMARALRLSVSQVEQSLASGHSPADLAAAQSVPLQQLREALLAEIQKELNAQVQSGSLSQTDAAQVYQKFAQGGVDQILNDKKPAGN